MPDVSLSYCSIKNNLFIPAATINFAQFEQGDKVQKISAPIAFISFFDNSAIAFYSE